MGTDFSTSKFPVPILAIAAVGSVGLAVFQVAQGRDVWCNGRLLPSEPCSSDATILTEIDARSAAAIESIDERKSAALGAIQESLNSAEVKIRSATTDLANTIASGEQFAIYFSPRAFRMNKDATISIEHGLEAIPLFVQVWSSVSEDGPWELIDPIFSYREDVTNLHYGTYIADVSANKLTLLTGNHSATSTYGGDTSHWQKYHGGAAPYDPLGAWFRVTAIAAKPDD